MALSGMKVQHIQASVCQQESTPGVSTSSCEIPAVCLISWQNTCRGLGGGQGEKGGERGCGQGKEVSEIVRKNEMR